MGAEGLGVHHHHCLHRVRGQSRLDETLCQTVQKPKKERKLQNDFWERS